MTAINYVRNVAAVLSPPVGAAARPSVATVVGPHMSDFQTDETWRVRG